MMDEKMKAAFDAWVLDKAVASEWVSAESGVEWTLDYLRSQQEPIGYLLDWPSQTGKRDPIFCKSRKTGELNGLKDEHIYALYTTPIPRAPAVPEGWKKVPAVATIQMFEAFDDWYPPRGKDYAGGQGVSSQKWWDFRHRYEAMLAAAPSSEKKED